MHSGAFKQGSGGQLWRGLTALAVLALSLAWAPASWGAAAYGPAGDPYSMVNVTSHIGATTWWKAGFTGKGVDVAVIDTGVSPVPGLDAGKVVYGPDLSLESQAPNLRNLDTNGHGTFMAGLIAGRDSSLTTPYANSPATAYRGVAPDARIISIKVATADGGADVSQVIAAIYWVIQHARDPGLNIRVINLSYGTNSKQTYLIDPLSYAAELAWKKGIVVVSAAGNTGFQRGNGAPGLADPAQDPYVIGVGGYDTMGTAAFDDDQIGSYSASSAGCSSCKDPDFVAAGSHLQGLRVPNSYVDAKYPEGRIDSRYFRATGTSGAAAITSGAIALILQKYPNLTPDQVKRFIAANARKIPGTVADAQGAGEMNLLILSALTPAAATQMFMNATGRGSLELARGSDHLTDDGVLLTGERDIFGQKFSSSGIASAAASGGTWSGGTWNGNAWSGNSWSGNSWSGNSWSGNSWSGNSWSSGVWAGGSWLGATWD